MSFDTYFDPPVHRCPICNGIEEDCTCDPCRICGETGNPACIAEHGLQAVLFEDHEEEEITEPDEMKRREEENRIYWEIRELVEAE